MSAVAVLHTSYPRLTATGPIADETDRRFFALEMSLTTCFRGLHAHLENHRRYRANRFTPTIDFKACFSVIMSLGVRVIDTLVSI